MWSGRTDADAGTVHPVEVVASAATAVAATPSRRHLPSAAVRTTSVPSLGPRRAGDAAGHHKRPDTAGECAKRSQHAKPAWRPESFPNGSAASRCRGLQLGSAPLAAGQRNRARPGRQVGGSGVADVAPGVGAGRGLIGAEDQGQVDDLGARVGGLRNGPTGWAAAAAARGCPRPPTANCSDRPVPTRGRTGSAAQPSPGRRIGVHGQRDQHPYVVEHGQGLARVVLAHVVRAHLREGHDLPGSRP